MPATITHAYFGKDLYNKLPANIKQTITSEKNLMMFSQSMDALMFFHIYIPFNGKETRNIAPTFHNNKIDDFFSTLINYMKDNEYYKDSQTLTFLYGLISHFFLDSRAHPFIFYKTGYFDKKNKESYKYNSCHTYMETYIDNYFYNTRNNKKYINFSNFCFDLTKFSKPLNNCIDYSFEKIFNINNMSSKYYQSLKDMKNFLTLFRIDNYGVKKQIYKFIDLLTPVQCFKFKSLSYHLDNYENFDFLNNKHKEWTYPVDNSIKSNYNFNEIYNNALEEATNAIKEINSFFFKNKKINISTIFQNKSYVTGIDYNKNKPQIFFEF